jgi:hypothetical protein
MLKMLSAVGLTMTLVLGGCASLNRIDSEVTTFGPWPTDRQAGTFTFDRLPSQQVHPEHRQMLEDAARGALEAAGFRVAVDSDSAEYLMQLGARIELNDPWIYNQPLFVNGGWGWPYGGYGYGRWGRRPFGFNSYWGGRGYWGPGYDTPTFDREVALVIRDNKTGKLLYETRAASSGFSDSLDAVMPAMFAAALEGFPNAVPETRSVTTQITQTAPVPAASAAPVKPAQQ